MTKPPPAVMMTELPRSRDERRYRARVLLCDAIGRHGTQSDEARQAAIEFCNAHEIDPNFRYAVYHDWRKPPPRWDGHSPPEPPRSITEWEVQVGRFARELGLNGELWGQVRWLNWMR